MSAEAVSKLCYDLEKIKFPINHAIIKENTEAHSFYIIKRGIV